ncbi:DUF1275 domain-containing protein [Paroceanicella profunda]|uniref:DUF1275 domain-containing protein n=1 Tax=Paroceanicella profunda TaxID=2579971 RepID=A0A5B8FVF2_9RHOB|nr:YoaK family protein [Paroceanicella profunda]QDL91100.1 DUF1275 domain-containing protein [Paroceanicella profunda]
MPDQTAPPMPSPLPGFLLLLSATTGMIDAISVLGLGNVFTANMTGNVVFLGFAAAGESRFAPLSLAMALLAFLVGATLSGCLANRYRAQPPRRWLLFSALAETGPIWAAAASCFWAGDGGLVLRSGPEGGLLLAAIACLGFAMGFRNATIRRLGVADLTTTVLTLTLTGLAADSSLAGGADPNLRRRIGAVVAMFAGAFIGAGLMRIAGLVVPLLLAGLIVLGATLAIMRHPFLARPLPAKPG